jgi:hypothetical protein
MTIAVTFEALPENLGAAAAAYAAAGIRVFPCAPGGKQPLTTTGFRAATTELRQIRRWWAWQPEANIGIATGHGLDVLDVDVHPSGDGYGMLRALHQAGLTAGWAQTVRTPSGGLHLYFPSDPEAPQPTWARGRAHIDFRGTGGYVIAPPSRILIDGRPRGYEVLAYGRQPAPVRADTIRRLLTPEPAPGPARASAAGLDRGRRVERIAEWLERVPEGNRNAGLFWAACRLAELGFSEPEARQVLGDPARATGLDDREIDATIHSAHRTVALSPADAAPRLSGTGTSRALS